MLWQKAWLETRVRLLLGVVLSIYVIYLLLFEAPAEVAQKFPDRPPAEVGAKLWKLFLIAYGGVVLPVTAKILAGSGINAQTSMGMSRGFHGSMSFLLSMPVTRAQLILTRAAAGAILTALTGLIALTTFVTLAPGQGIHLPPINFVQSYGSMMVITTFFYCLSVLLTTLLDEFWSGTIGLIILSLMLGYSFALSGTAFDLIQTLEQPTLATTLTYLTLSAILFLAAIRVVEAKEY